MAISNLHLSQTITNTNNLKIMFFVSLLLIYFAWMDIALYINLQRWSPPLSQYEASNLIVPPQQAADNGDLSGEQHHHRYAAERRRKYANKTNLGQGSLTTNNNNNNILDQPFTVFSPLSVKLIMVDHMTHYVHDIVARFIEDTLHLSTNLPFVTPNVVSFTGLALAFIGCSLIAFSNDPAHMRLGAVLFELRNLADSLDGVVYRSQTRQKRLILAHNEAVAAASTADSLEDLAPNILASTPKSEVYQSNYGSTGYNVDMICDGLGGLLFILAIAFKYLRHLPYVKGHERVISDEIELLKPSSSSSSSSSSIIPMHQITHRAVTRHFTSRQVKLIIAAFALRLLFTGLIWDHFVHKYHDLLMVLSSNPRQRTLQIQAFKSIGMWLVMWFWRLGNACAILEHLAISTFFNKLWDYLVFSNYIGWAYLIIITLITQIHYIELYSSLNSFSAFT